MTPNYCPNCGADLQGMSDGQAEETEAMPEDYAPDLPAENQDPPMDQTVEEARSLVDAVSHDPNSPLVGQLTGVRSMLQELEDAMQKGESLDQPYYRQTAFGLAKELERLSPMRMVARWNLAGVK